MGGCRDPGVAQVETIVAGLALGLRCKSGPMQRPVEEIARTISREHTASAIGAVGTGREPDDEKTGIRVAEGRDWFAPVFPVDPGPALSDGDGGAVVDEPGALSAG